jgi:pentatricopeptide repeat-containing protein PET309
VALENEETKPEEPQDPESIEQARRNQADLYAFLKLNSHQYEIAWIKFVAAGRPAKLVSPLCAYMSSSKDFNIQKRAWQLFQQIPPEERTKYDFKNILKSQLIASTKTKPRYLYSICEQVISTPFALPILSRVVAHHVENREWARLTKVWKLLLDTSKRQNPLLESLDSLLSRITPSRFPEYSLSRHLLDLADFVAYKKNDIAVKDFTRRLLDLFISCPDFIKLTPMTTLLDLLRKYHSLGVLGRKQWYDLIEFFVHSEKRSEFIQSILLYRQYRLLLPEERAPKKLLPLFLERLLAFEIPETMEYFLDEIALFYKKPSITDYKHALTGFSRAADAQSVHRIFDRFLADHGKPKSRRILAPVLSVHARLGDLPETQRQFERISAEFNLVPNTVCWNILISAHATAGDLQGALSTFSHMLKSGVPLDSHTFGTLLPLFSKRGDIVNVRRLITEAQNRNVKITRPIIDTAVHVYCTNGQLAFAEQLAEASWNVAEGGSPVRMWNILLMHYAFRVSKFSFRRVLDRIGKLGLKPDAMTHGAIMLAYAIAKQPGFARDTLRRMHRMGMEPTPFHYTVLIYGYLKMRNRDMVHVILGEMETRFGKVGLNANLLNLKMQIRRDLENAYDQAVPSEEVVLKHAEDTLFASIKSFEVKPSPAKHTTPNSAAGSALDHSTAMHYQHMIQSYSAKGATEKAFEMLSQYLNLRKLAGAPADDLESLPFEFVKAMMMVYLKAQDFEKVEECWYVLLDSAHKRVGHMDIEGILSGQTSAPEMQAPVDSETETQILPHHRFVLELPLTLYIRSLACREQFERLPNVITEVENAGFQFTGLNWSNYISAFASSGNFDDILTSFRLFEDKFYPHFPGWSWMIKGYGIRPLHAPVTILHLDGKYGVSKSRRMMGNHARRHWRKIEPDYMHPHYPTMVLLASTLRRIRDASIDDGTRQMEDLHKAAPNTFEALSAMPYLRDKYQGALLRDRAALDNALPLPIKLFTTRTGALGLETKLKKRTFQDAKRQPLDFEIYAQSARIDEQNVTKLLTIPDSARLGSLLSILPRADRIELETQHYEYRKLTAKWKIISQRRQSRIANSFRHHKGRLHGIPVKASIKTRGLKVRPPQQHLFDKYYGKWKQQKKPYLLYKPVTGLEERRRYRPYSRRGLKRRGVGRRRTRRQDEPPKRPPAPFQPKSSKSSKSTKPKKPGQHKAARAAAAS